MFCICIDESKFYLGIIICTVDYVCMYVGSDDSLSVSSDFEVQRKPMFLLHRVQLEETLNGLILPI